MSQSVSADGSFYEIQDKELRRQVHSMLSASLKCDNDDTFPVATFQIYDGALKNAIYGNPTKLPPHYSVLCKIQCYNSMVNIMSKQSSKKCITTTSEKIIESNELQLINPDLRNLLIDRTCFIAFIDALWKWNAYFIDKARDKAEIIHFDVNVCLEEV